MQKGVSVGLPMDEIRNVKRLARRERGVWQRRYWEHLIRDDNDLRRHVEYIHFNPVKHGHSPGRWIGRTRRFVAGSSAGTIRLIGAG
jgi:hypothetical protein